MSKSQSRTAILKRMMGGRPGAHLFGKRQVGLSPEEVRKNVNYGTDPDRDTRWPLGHVEENPLAADVVRATEEGTR